MSRVRLRDIAEDVGCSVAAVSKILNNARTSAVVGPDLADRIRTAALKLGYSVNYHAQALTHGRSGTIGALHPPQRAHVFWAQVLTGAHQGVCARDHRLLLLSSAEDAVEAWQQQRIDAVIVPWAFFADHIEPLRAAGVPLVAIGAGAPSGITSVRIAMETAVQEAVHLIHARGHQRVTWLHPVVDGTRIDQDRFPALRNACMAAGLELDEWEHVVPDHDLVDAFTDDLMRMLRQRWQPQQQRCIFCFNERMVPPVYSLIQEQGLRIGRDCDVLACDNLIAPMLAPGLTTIATDFDTLGSLAADSAIDLASNRRHTAAREVRAHLIIRASCHAS